MGEMTEHINQPDHEKDEIMIVSKVSDLLVADDGDQPKAVRARLKSVFKRREGESNGRAYSFEDFELDDGAKSIKCQLANHPAFDRKWIGRDIYFEAHKGEKGWTGLYIVDEKWTPKDSDEERIFRKLKVTATAKISLASDGESDNDGGNVVQPEDDIPYGSDSEAQTDEQKAIAKAEAMLADAKKKQADKARLAELHAKQEAEKKLQPAPAGNTAAAKVFMGRAANAMLLCLKAAEYVGKTYTDKSPAMIITPEQFQAITSTFFIAMDKRGLVDCMPVKPMEDEQ